MCTNAFLIIVVSTIINITTLVLASKTIFLILSMFWILLDREIPKEALNVSKPFELLAFCE